MAMWYWMCLVNLSQERGYGEMLYADALVVMAETKEELQQRIMEWQESVEKMRLRVNPSQTEVMVCSKVGGEQVRIEDKHEHQLKQVQSFKYLGAAIEETGGTDVDVRERVEAA